MKKILLTLPLIIVLVIFVFLIIYLLQDKNPNEPPSALLNKNLPKFNTVNLYEKNKSLSNKNLKEKFILINFFASWCIPCREEHHLLFEIKKRYNDLFIVGINHKDKKSDALKYLDEEGDPYDYVGLDKDGLIALEFGVFGLPETFLINDSGKIIYKNLGPLTKKILKNEIYPNIK